MSNEIWLHNYNDLREKTKVTILNESSKLDLNQEEILSLSFEQ